MPTRRLTFCFVRTVRASENIHLSGSHRIADSCITCESVNLLLVVSLKHFVDKTSYFEGVRLTTFRDETMIESQIVITRTRHESRQHRRVHDEILLGLSQDSRR